MTRDNSVSLRERQHLLLKDVMLSLPVSTLRMDQGNAACHTQDDHTCTNLPYFYIYIHFFHYE